MTGPSSWPVWFRTLLYTVALMAPVLLWTFTTSATANGAAKKADSNALQIERNKEAIGALREERAAAREWQKGADKKLDRILNLLDK